MGTFIDEFDANPEQFQYPSPLIILTNTCRSRKEPNEIKSSAVNETYFDFPTLSLWGHQFS